MADLSFDDLIPKKSEETKAAPATAGALSFDDLIPKKDEKDTSFTGALKYGVNQAVQGLANTDSALAQIPIVGKYYSAGEQPHSDALPFDTSKYDPAGGHFSALDPSTYGYAPRAALEATVGNAPTIGAAIGTGGIGAGLAYGAQNYGNEVRDRAIANRHTQADGNDLAGAALGTLGGAALAGLGGGGVGGRLATTALGRIAGNTAADAALGAGTAVTDQLGTTAGTTSGAKLDPTAIVNAGAFGGALGAVGHVAREGGAVVGNAVKDRAADRQFGSAGLDPNAVQSLDQRITQSVSNGVGDLSSPTGRYKTMQGVSDGLKSDLADITSKNGGVQFERNGGVYSAHDFVESLSPWEKRQVQTGIKRVQSGENLTESLKTDLDGILSGSGDADAQVLHSLIQQHDTFNTLVATGKADKASQTFQSGYVDPGTIPNPKSSIKTAIGSALGGGALAELAADGAVHGGMSLLGHGAAIAGGAALPIAAMLAARLGRKGYSSLTGADNSLGQFQRFAANTAPASGLPPLPLTPAMQARIAAMQAPPTPVPAAPQSPTSALPPLPAPVAPPLPAKPVQAAPTSSLAAIPLPKAKTPRVPPSMKVADVAPNTGIPDLGTVAYDSAPGIGTARPTGRAPQSLVDRIRAAGGVRDEGGDLAAAGLHKVINPRGMSLDKMREMMAEEGYLGADTDAAVSNTTVRDLIDAIENPTYSVHDDGALAQRGAYADGKANRQHFLDQRQQLHALLGQEEHGGFADNELDGRTLTRATYHYMGGHEPINAYELARREAAALDAYQGKAAKPFPSAWDAPADVPAPEAATLDQLAALHPQIQAAIARRRIDAAANNAIPVAPADTPVAQPKFNSGASAIPTGEMAPPDMIPGGIRARAMAAAQARKPLESLSDAPEAEARSEAPKLESTAPKDEGDGFTVHGIFFPWPKNGAINRAAYKRSAEDKQNKIDSHIQSAIEKTAHPDSADVIQDGWMDLKTARNQDSARGVVNKMIANVAKEDRGVLDKVFDDKFFSGWRKKTADSK